MPTFIKLPPQNPQLFTKQSQFIFQKQIGEGAFARVFACIEISSNQAFALKIIDLNKLLPNDIENIETEIAIHSQMHNDYIIRLHGFFQEDSSVCLVTELLSKGNLFCSMHRRWPDEYEVKKIFRQVCLGMAYLHRKNVIMRDLKPENLLLTDSKNVKMCDFGWAAYVADNAYCRLSAGTLTYMSPECLRNEKQDLASDIWTLGIFLYELTHCREPFPGKTKNEMIDLLKMPKMVLKNTLKKEEINLILKLLELDAKKRPTIEQILKDPIFDSLFSMGYQDLHLSELTTKTKCPNNLSLNTTKIAEKKLETFSGRIDNLRTLENVHREKKNEFVSLREVRICGAGLQKSIEESLEPMVLVSPPEQEINPVYFCDKVQSGQVDRTETPINRITLVQYRIDPPRVKSELLEQSLNTRIENLQSPKDKPLQKNNTFLSSTHQPDSLMIGRLVEQKRTSIQHSRIIAEQSSKVLQFPGNMVNDHSREDDSLQFKGSVKSEIELEVNMNNLGIQIGRKFGELRLNIPLNLGLTKDKPVTFINHSSTLTGKRVLGDKTQEVINVYTREIKREEIGEGDKVNSFVKNEDVSNFGVKKGNASFDSLDVPRIVNIGRVGSRRYTLIENRSVFEN